MNGSTGVRRRRVPSHAAQSHHDTALVNRYVGSRGLNGSTVESGSVEQLCGNFSESPRGAVHAVSTGGCGALAARAFGSDSDVHIPLYNDNKSFEYEMHLRCADILTQPRM